MKAQRKIWVRGAGVGAGVVDAVVDAAVKTGVPRQRRRYLQAPRTTSGSRVRPSRRKVDPWSVSTGKRRRLRHARMVVGSGAGADVTEATVAVTGVAAGVTGNALSGVSGSDVRNIRWKALRSRLEARSR